jgi:hypothetical protein
MGVRDACERSELDQKQAVIDKTAHVRDQLAPHRAMIETLTSEQAGDNELQLVGLLDRLLLTPAGIA